MATHLIGLTLGMETDWPTAFEALLDRCRLRLRIGGETHTFETERVTYEPFSLADRPRHRAIIDRVGWWYPMPREWLKKIAMMDEVYLLNDPFTFQSMEKHTAYCAMLRLGLRIPETWMLPHKMGPPNERYEMTARRYNQLFDLEALGSRLGYPLYMKPFDGGGWRGVTRIGGPEQLRDAYDQSSQSLMHLQKAVEPFEHFARCLSIGPQSRVMRYRPERPMHDRYAPELGFLEPPVEAEVASISRVINAFFRWEFNSCETLLKDGIIHPIDFANACPDVAITSLHTHFPWAMTALLRWTIFCAATERRMAIDMNKREYFVIADRAELTAAEKLRRYEDLAMDYFDAEAFESFCAEHLAHVEEVADEYFAGSAFDDLLVRTVRETFPAHEHDAFIGQYRGAIGGR